MTTRFDLEKLIWDENDFEQMGWHDSKIYALAFKGESFELVLDIDYILEWINPEEGKTHFKFWVAPATLVFRNVWDLKINIEGNPDLEMQDLHRENPHPPKNAKHIQEAVEYDWRIETQNGEIAFKSVGFKQYFRKNPVMMNSQMIELNERGGISFEIIS
jgi:hypothetical protein